MVDNDEAMFREAMEAAPEECGPHLAFADWLDAQGRDDEAHYHRRWTPEVAWSEKWLADFAKDANLDYGKMIKGVLRYAMTGEPMPTGMNFEPGSLMYGSLMYPDHPGDPRYGGLPLDDSANVFWGHVATALGIEIEESRRDADLFECCAWGVDCPNLLEEEQW